MSIAPRPSPSPKVPLGEGADTPSGVYRAINSEVQQAWWHTKIQWGVVGAFLIGAGTFVSWSLNKLDMVNTAMAQSAATTTATASKADLLERRIDAVDAGTRQAVERLERKIDANAEATERKLSEILREVKRR